MGPQQRDGYVKGSPGLANYTGVKDGRIHAKWRAEGLPYLRLSDKCILYKKRDVDLFLDRKYGVNTWKPGTRKKQL